MRKGAMGPQYMLTSAAAIVGVIAGTEVTKETSGVLLEDSRKRVEQGRFEFPPKVCAQFAVFDNNGNLVSRLNGWGALDKKMDKLLKEEGRIAVYCERKAAYAKSKGLNKDNDDWLQELYLATQ
jgi:hypothetical protein